MKPGRRVSAFSVFKSKKNNGSTTPTTNGQVKSGEPSPASSEGKMRLKDVIRESLRKRKSDTDIKKIPKNLRNSVRGRPSFTPENAKTTVSPAKERVKLTGLRTRSSPSRIKTLPPLPPTTQETSRAKVKKISTKDLICKTESIDPNHNEDGDSSSILNITLTSQSTGSPGSSKHTPTKDPTTEATLVIPTETSKSVTPKRTPKVKTPKAKTPKTKTPKQTPKAGTPKQTPKKKTPKAVDKKGSTPKSSVSPTSSTTSEKENSLQNLDTPSSSGSNKKRRKGKSPAGPPKRRKTDEAGDGPSITLPFNLATPSQASDNTEDDSSDTGVLYDSRIEASNLFRLMIHPVKPEKFFSELWEKKPLLVKRHMPTYNQGWFSCEEMDKVLREERLMFDVNIDITTYTDGVRETHNPEGRAYPSIVWDYFQNGCSIRMLNPQTFSKNVWRYLSVLQEYFGSGVGANVYLTPPGTQGFAPHYDDIEAFVLQLEGKKHWKVYSPRSENESLPKFSSENFTAEDLGDPILEVELEAGDLLYFPRGFIHQASTPEGQHSLHITVSTCQKNSWGDLLEKLIPQAISTAFEEDVEFRQAIPREYMNYMGIAHSDQNNPMRQAFLRKIETLMTKLLTHASVDGACDQMAKRYLYDTLPPVLTESEKSRSIYKMGEAWNGKEMRVTGRVEVEPDTEVKIIRNGAIRLLAEDSGVQVYHSIDNTRIYHEYDLQPLPVTAEQALAIEHLINAYPNYTKVEDLPLETESDKVDIVTQLYERGLVVTAEPLELLSDVSCDDED